MKRRNTEAARQQARDQLLGQFDWRDLMAADPDTRATVPPIRSKLQLSAVEREILKLYRQGLRPADLATLFALNDATVEALLFGEEGTA